MTNHLDNPLPITRSELGRLEVHAEWLRVFGELVIEPPVNVQHVTAFGRCSVGAFSYTNHDVEMWNTDVGRFCSIGQGVIINPGTHPTNFLTSHPIGASRSGESAGLADFSSYAGFAMTGMINPVHPTARSDRVDIGHDVWIGARAIITTDVTIGVGAIIGANAVVTKDVPPFGVVGGAPAALIRLRFTPDIQTRILASRWWDHDLSGLPLRDYSQVERMLDLIEAAKSEGRLQPFRPSRWLIDA